MSRRSHLTGVDAVIVLDRVAAAVLGVVANSFAQVVHAVLAAGSGGEAVTNEPRLKNSNKHNSPTTEADAGAGEVLVRKEAAVGHELAGDFPVEALAQSLREETGR